MLRRINAVLRQARDEGGYALLVVIGVGVVLLAMVATALTVATSGYRKSANDDDWNGALAAAYGGLEEYQSRLTNDSTYYTYGNPSAPFSTASGSTLSLPTGSKANPAFGAGSSGTWASIPGSDGQSWYRYEVDNSAYVSKGTLRLRVTGKVGTQTRSIVADLRQTGFIDFLYLTMYEASDPALSGLDCEKFEWSTARPSRDSRCAIEFAQDDVISGPVHSDDTLLICGSTFKGAVTTSRPDGGYKKPRSSCKTPTFQVGTGPVYRSSPGFPATNSDMMKETRNDLPADVPRPGCLYTGPTSITFLANGKVKIVSPWTKFTNVSYTAGKASTNPPQCGQPGTAPGQLGHPDGATLDVLSSNLAYVQNVPSGNDPNAWNSNARPPQFSCTGTGALVGWKFGSAQYPLTNEVAPTGTSATTPAYKCTNGDVYVKGTVNGQMTVASQNFIYVTGDITYADSQDDLLGLVGQNAVWVWDPYNKNNVPINDAKNRTINAAILSVSHTFTVQNYDKGVKRGTLSITGAIAQKFRGPVGQAGGTGYIKKYTYDTRFRNTAPPKFLTPTSTTYGVTQVASVPSAFSATGATQ